MGGQQMTITLFIFNLIWILLGIIVFIYLLILLRAYKRNMDAQAKENKISHITTKKVMRDLHIRYGNFGAAKKLDEQIKQCLEEMEE